MGELNIECTICGKSFDSENNYTIHQCVDAFEPAIKEEPREDYSEVPLKEPASGNLSLTTEPDNGVLMIKEEPDEDGDHADNVDQLEDEVDPLKLQVDSGDANADDKACSEKKDNGDSVIKYNRQYNCRLCMKTFTNSVDFAKHFTNFHKNYKPYECNVCGKKFLQKHYVTLHMRVHTGEKPFKCSICPKAYSHKTSYIIHMRIHRGERPFICSVCGKRCYDKSGLTSHMRSHTKETPYSCEICDRKFTHSKSLLVHRRNHTGEKPYQCQFCGKCFRHWHKHKIHVRLHTGERPYFCKVCGKRFPRNDEVNRHMKSHEGIKSFKCAICGVYCATQASITGHINLHHLDLQETVDSMPEKTIVQDSNSGILGSRIIENRTRRKRVSRKLPKITEGMNDGASITEKAMGSTRVIEITSKESPLPFSLKRNSKSRMLPQVRERSTDTQTIEHLDYKEFLVWQERMLEKQGLVVKKYPCESNNDNSTKVNEKTPCESSEKNTAPLSTGERLRNALTAGKSDDKQEAPDKSKLQYILLSNPTGNGCKILVPLSMASQTKVLPSSSSTPQIVPPALQLPTIAPTPQPVKTTSCITTPQPSTSKEEQRQSLLFLPPSLNSQQQFIMVSNPVNNQKMLLVVPQVPSQKNESDNVPAVEIKPDPDAPPETSDMQNVAVDRIKRECPSPDIEIKQEIEDH